MGIQETKQQTVELLAALVERLGSQNKAAKSLGVSSAIVSQMLNGKWETIADEMWRGVAAKLGYTAKQWNTVQTRDFKLIYELLEDAQEYSNVFACIGDAGSGKSVAIEAFAAEHKNVFVLRCSEFWNRKVMLSELLQAMGRDCSGLTVAEMMADTISTLKKMEVPVIPIDEADKLSDQLFYFLITIYNQLEGHCGIALFATDHLEKRIRRGLRLNKKGYKEIYSRIGRKFITLKGVGSTDVAQICAANGISDATQVKEIIQDCENDLRRVKRKIHAIKKQQLKAA